MPSDSPTTLWSVARVDWLRQRCIDEGFALAGVAPAPLADEPDGVLTAERFDRWIELGRAGEMAYLERRDEAGELLRRSARVAMPWARSVVVCALNYHLAGPGGAGPASIDPAPANQGWIARYAWSATQEGSPLDYHEDMLRRLRAVEADLRVHLDDAATDLISRSYVDTGPILERDFAARAGVGWVGKNTCVIHQEMGSWLLLGVIVTSLEVAPEAVATLAPDRCGSCTRCIDACPTDALVAPREMDATRCISYLTIEHKGAIAEELRAPMGRQVFGCDICQDVCPWNRKAPAGDAWERHEELVNPDLGWLGELDAAEFKRLFAGSPLERTKRHRLQRNVAIAMGNSGETRFVPQLEQWAANEDAVLAASARWALERLAASASIGLLAKSRSPAAGGRSADVDVREEGPAGDVGRRR